MSDHTRIARNPHEFTIVNSKEGFYLVDEFGDDAETPSRLYASWKDANDRRRKLVEDDEDDEGSD